MDTLELSQDNVKELIENIKNDMQMNCNERRTLKERKSAEGQHKLPHTAPDVNLWQDQLDALESAGHSNITIGYWRLSTSKQTDGYGAEVQQKHIISWCIAEKISGIVSGRGIDMWVWDVDSGKEEARVGFDFIREAAKTGNVQNVVVYRHDRLARNQYFAELMQREFKKTYTRLYSATENLPDGAVGDLMRQVVQAIAQYEAAMIAERLSRGKKESIRRKGVYNGGEVPYGYLAKGTRGETGKGVLVICEAEARIIRLIFMLHERGFNQSAIARALNGWGIPTRHRGLLGWRQGQIRRIICAEAQYRGEALFSRGITDFEIVAHEPILEYRADSSKRSYLYGNVELLKSGTQVPDDIYGTAVPQKPRKNSKHSLSEAQARTLILMYQLKDQGMLQTEILRRLNALGLFSLEGKPWSPSNLGIYIKNRRFLEEKIQDIRIGDADLPVTQGSDERSAQIEMELQSVALIKSLHHDGTSIAKIVAHLQESSLVTRNGCKWHPSTVHRVVKGYLRDSQMASV